MGPRDFSFSRLRRSALSASLLVALGAGGACTQVAEQPVLEPPPPPPAPPPPKQKLKPVVRHGWPSSTSPSAPTPAPREPAPAADTLNGDPDGLKREQLQAVMDAAMPQLTDCYANATGTTKVALSFDVTPTGKADNIKVSGGGAGDSCVSSAVARLPLPRFTGKPVPVYFPLTIQRTVTQQAPSQPSQPAGAGAGSTGARPAGAAQPVFVNPSSRNDL